MNPACEACKRVQSQAVQWLTRQVENFLKAFQLETPEFRSSSGSAPELDASCSDRLPRAKQKRQKAPELRLRRQAAGHQDAVSLLATRSRTRCMACKQVAGLLASCQKQEPPTTALDAIERLRTACWLPPSGCEHASLRSAEVCRAEGTGSTCWLHRKRGAPRRRGLLPRPPRLALHS